MRGYAGGPKRWDYRGERDCGHIFIRQYSCQNRMHLILLHLHHSYNYFSLKNCLILFTFTFHSFNKHYMTQLPKRRLRALLLQELSTLT